MRIIIYFQYQSKTNASDKYGGIQEIAHKLNWHVRVHEGLPDAKTIRELIAFWNPDGMIFACGGTAVTVDSSVFGKLPVVFFDHDPSRLPAGAFSVSHDSSATARMAFKELALAGANDFAYIPYPEKRFWSDERGRAFADAVRLNGGRMRKFSWGGLDAGDSAAIRRQRVLRKFLPTLPRPCALMAANDRIAAEVLAAAESLQIRVPHDLAVVGVDNAKDICESTAPTLSSVRPDFYAGGRMAAIMLEAMIVNGKSFMGERRMTFGPLEVVRRASTHLLGGFADSSVAAALDMIRRKSCEGLKAADVLKAFRCPRRQAEIRFRKATDHSILEEIHAVRLARAKELLENSDMQLEAIAGFCGFETPNALRKFFSAQTGMTMGAWRKKHATALAKARSNDSPYHHRPHHSEPLSNAFKYPLAKRRPRVK